MSISLLSYFAGGNLVKQPGRNVAVRRTKHTPKKKTVTVSDVEDSDDDIIIIKKKHKNHESHSGKSEKGDEKKDDKGKEEKGKEEKGKEEKGKEEKGKEDKGKKGDSGKKDSEDGEKKGGGKKSGREFTNDEDKTMLAMRKQGKAIKPDICKVLKASPTDIEARLKELDGGGDKKSHDKGGGDGNEHEFSKKQDKTIMSMKKASKSWGEIADAVNSTKGHVKHRFHELEKKDDGKKGDSGSGGGMLDDFSGLFGDDNDLGGWDQNWGNDNNSSGKKGKKDKQKVQDNNPDDSCQDCRNCPDCIKEKAESNDTQKKHNSNDDWNNNSTGGGYNSDWANDNNNNNQNTNTWDNQDPFADPVPNQNQGYSNNYQAHNPTYQPQNQNSYHNNNNSFQNQNQHNGNFQQHNDGRRRLRPNAVWTQEDCEMLEELEQRYVTDKWLHITASFYNMTGRMIDHSVIEGKFREDGVGRF